MARDPLTEVLRSRCTATTKTEVLAEAEDESRDESDMLRVLVNEALAARAADRRAGRRPPLRTRSTR